MASRALMPARRPGAARSGSLTHETARQPRHEGNRAGSHEALIIETHAACVFAEAQLDERRNADVAADLLSAGHGEVVVLYAVADVARDAYAFPDEREPHDQHLELDPRPPPQRHGATVPGHPVDEEQDVACLLLHHRLESVDQLGREESPASGRGEQAECQEAVDGLA